MPRTAKVTTVDGNYTYELTEKRFQGVDSENGSFNSYSATRAEFKRIINLFDKYIAKNGKPEVDEFDHLPFVTDCKVVIDTTWGDREKSVYPVYFNEVGGFDIGCMEFSKASITKMRKWATGASAKASKTLKAAA